MNTETAISDAHVLVIGGSQVRHMAPIYARKGVRSTVLVNSGYRSDQIAHELEDLLETGPSNPNISNPTAVVLQAGTNDIIQAWNRDRDVDQPSLVKKLVDTGKQLTGIFPSVQTVILTPLAHPARSSFKQRCLIDKLNSRIKTAAKQNNFKYANLDWATEERRVNSLARSSGKQQTGIHARDALHLNFEGKRLLVESTLPFLA
jgi:lysophospholipase L1-like esterase